MPQFGGMYRCRNIIAKTDHLDNADQACIIHWDVCRLCVVYMHTILVADLTPFCAKHESCSLMHVAVCRCQFRYDDCSES